MTGSEPPMMMVSFVRHFNIRLGEWLAACLLVSMAVLFLLEPRMFERSPNYFGTMAQLLSQPAWGVVFSLLGSCRMIALYINGRMGITPYIRMGLAFISCFVWWQVTISLFASGVPGLGWAVVPWLLALDMYNVFRSSADAREVFDAKRATRNYGTEQI